MAIYNYFLGLNTTIKKKIECLSADDFLLFEVPRIEQNVMWINYLSHLLITLHLLPIMKQSGEDNRIILVSSVAHNYLISPFNLEQITTQLTNDAFERFHCMVTQKFIRHLKALFSIPLDIAITWCPLFRCLKFQ